MDVMTIVGPVALCIGAIAVVAALYALFTFIKDRRREKREAHAPPVIASSRPSSRS